MKPEALGSALPDDLLEASLSADKHADGVQASSFCVGLREILELGMLLCFPLLNP